MRTRQLLFAFFGCLAGNMVIAQQLDFSKAIIISPGKKNLLVQKAITVFREEIYKRTTLILNIDGKRAADNKTIFVIATDKDLSEIPEQYKAAVTRYSTPGKDGFRVVIFKNQKVILAIGHDARGTLYAIGYLLRKMELRKHQIFVPSGLNTTSTPAYPIRGHQLGYRPKTNAYDAWTVKQFDQYIRELALFGSNSIEILPPHTDDDFSNEHMKLPAIKMIAEQSRICNEYGLDVWMWYPNMGSNYTSPDSITVQLNECEKVFRVLPKLNALFVPGGDPGELQPDVLFNWLRQMALVLHKYHPQAKIWVSPQVFRPTQQWFDSFYKQVNKGYSWFGGVVYGPWVSEPIQLVRKQVRKNIPIRQYPDITHSLSCQYPVPEWDLAYAVTLGRECYNPRPNDEKHIHNIFARYSKGSISYSEGINDDVNKFVWSGQDWNPNTAVIKTLRDYARFFIGPDFTESFAKGILALEDNFHGPLLSNGAVAKTLEQWKEMERNATPEVLANFRFQMGLIRAYYDAYIQRRLIYETDHEKTARAALVNASATGSVFAIEEARRMLLKAVDSPVQTELRARCIALSDSLFRSIGSQLTIEKHGAVAGRGNFIDNIDLPLNNSPWLLSQFLSIEKLADENLRLRAIDRLLNRTNPGMGGYYDDLGTPQSNKRIVHQKTWKEDPGGLESPLTDFGVFLKGDEWVDVLPVGFEGKPIPCAWMDQATSLYNTPLILRYDHIVAKSRYTVRIAYTGRFTSKVKLVADGRYLVHDYIQTGDKPIYEFPVPAEAVADGKIEFTFTCAPGDRGTQVAEIWLIKN